VPGELGRLQVRVCDCEREAEAIQVAPLLAKSAYARARQVLSREWDGIGSHWNVIFVNLRRRRPNKAVPEYYPQTNATAQFAPKALLLRDGTAFERRDEQRHFLTRQCLVGALL
jgi:hypothetical protein